MRSQPVAACGRSGGSCSSRGAAGVCAGGRGSVVFRSPSPSPGCRWGRSWRRTGWRVGSAPGRVCLRLRLRLRAAPRQRSPTQSDPTAARGWPRPYSTPRQTSVGVRKLGSARSRVVRTRELQNGVTGFVHPTGHGGERCPRDFTDGVRPQRGQSSRSRAESLPSPSPALAGGGLASIAHSLTRRR